MHANLSSYMNAALAGMSIWLLAAPAFAGTKVQVGKPCDTSIRPSLAEVNHKPLTDLLQKYVDDKGLVAYSRWKANVGDLKALDDYLVRVGCVDLAKPADRPAQVAYWINVYNALTLKGILREYPITSIRERTSRLGGYNMWKDLLIWVDNHTYSLDDIEHQILRNLGEPRVHVALVCGAKGCPPLANEAYTATELDNQLTANGQRFFARPESLRVNPDGQIFLSPLLKWYGKDFGPSTADQLRTLRPLLPASADVEALQHSRAKVKYSDYDWSLNDQRPTAR
jgi:hypothetical protein